MQNKNPYIFRFIHVLHLFCPNSFIYSFQIPVLVTVSWTSFPGVMEESPAVWKLVLVLHELLVAAPMEELGEILVNSVLRLTLVCNSEPKIHSFNL